MAERLSCPLCRREHKTAVYKDRDGMWIAESLDKDGARHRIVATVKQHTAKPHRMQELLVLSELKRAAKRFEHAYGPYKIEQLMRGCPDHWHIHARWE